MARQAKAWQPVDHAVAVVLRVAFHMAAMGERQLAAATGMSGSRIRYLRTGEGAPATLGELQLLARACDYPADSFSETAIAVAAADPDFAKVVGPYVAEHAAGDVPYAELAALLRVRIESALEQDRVEARSRQVTDGDD